MAFTKSTKSAMMEEYSNWLEKSQAMFMIEFSKMTMREIDGIRSKIREAGGEAHVVKNTLISKVLEENNYAGMEDELTGTTLVGFAFDDAPALAKVVSDIVKSDAFKIKGGFLEKDFIDEAQIKNLASLPPLPIMRAKLLGTLLAPASQLVRVLAEPGRSVAAVIQAHVTQSDAPQSEPSAA